jgi:hypothetical protein
VIAAISITVIILLTLYIGWIFELDLQSSYLWIGAFFTFLAFFSLYIMPIYWKIAIMIAVIALISLSLIFYFDIPLVFSLMIGLAIVILMLSVYLSI